MLVRLMYASRATDAAQAETFGPTLKKWKEHNAEVGVTGVLCFCVDSGIFMQVLEGGRSQVNRLYTQIVRDPRHRDIELLSYEEIVERAFGGWSMGQVNMNRLNPALLLRYFETTVLDPYAVAGGASLALFRELVATASVVGQG
jgi:hypothetical protein